MNKKKIKIDWKHIDKLKNLNLKNNISIDLLVNWDSHKIL